MTLIQDGSASSIAAAAAAAARVGESFSDVGWSGIGQPASATRRRMLLVWPLRRNCIRRTSRAAAAAGHSCGGCNLFQRTTHHWLGCLRTTNRQPRCGHHRPNRMHRLWSAAGYEDRRIVYEPRLTHSHTKVVNLLFTTKLVEEQNNE